MTNKIISYPASIDLSEFKQDNPTTVKYGLPKNIKFCKKCVMTNQMPKSEIEHKHNISSKKESLDFYDDGICAACHTTFTQKKIEIDCFKLNTILDKNEIKKIDYLNIDAEENDFKVISTFDFERFKPLLVSIEFNNYDSDKLLESDIHTLMKNNGYKLISKFGVTCFYVENDTVSNVHEMMKI